VVEKLKPLIDSVYLTRRSRENTAVMGSSMGGLISLYFLVWYPDVFSKAGCLSTAIGATAGEKEFAELVIPSLRTKPRIYLDVGELEPSLVPGNRALVSYLQKNGFAEGRDLEFYFAKGALHNEQAWAARLWRPLLFLFGL
jgi:predicted alpha/beta superfamily hydrolase